MPWGLTQFLPSALVIKHGGEGAGFPLRNSERE